MDITTLADTKYFNLQSYANGWGYLLFNKSNKGTLWLQDDDAATFRAQLINLDRNGMSVQRALSEMWFTYISVADIPRSIQ